MKDGNGSGIRVIPYIPITICKLYYSYLEEGNSTVQTIAKIYNYNISSDRKSKIV